jgi:hypothetical protein
MTPLGRAGVCQGVRSCPVRGVSVRLAGCGGGQAARLGAVPVVVAVVVARWPTPVGDRPPASGWPGATWPLGREGCKFRVRAVTRWDRFGKISVVVVQTLGWVVVGRLLGFLCLGRRRMRAILRSLCCVTSSRSLPARSLGLGTTRRRIEWCWRCCRGCRPGIGGGHFWSLWPPCCVGTGSWSPGGGPIRWTVTHGGDCRSRRWIWLCGWPERTRDRARHALLGGAQARGDRLGHLGAVDSASSFSGTFTAKTLCGCRPLEWAL